MKVEKAIEISDAKIQFVSLVDKAANMRQFLITKADDGNAKFSTAGKILKFDPGTHYVTGVVYEPLIEDAHGNYMTEDEIRKAAYWFAKNGDKIDLQHSFEPIEGLAIVENYVAPADMEIEGQPILKGSWLMTVEVENDEIWDKVQKGEITGFSMGGVGKYSETETEPSVEKRSLFKKLAGLLGFKVVEKGEVKERFEENAKRDNFWNAFSALQSALFKYDWNADRERATDDEAVIREALEEFSEIVVSVLAAPNIMTVLTENAPVNKAGRKISGKNHEALQSVYNNLGALLEEFEERKEEEELTKEEVQKIVDEAIKDALAKLKDDKKEDDSKKEPEVTADKVEKMVSEAIKKALEPKDEPLTAEAVQTMVTAAVEKAVEPILKARGLPANLNGEKQIEKNENAHYLTGIL